MKDLKERFAQVDIHVSAPLVAFKESAFLPAEAPDVIPRPLKVFSLPKAKTHYVLSMIFKDHLKLARAVSCLAGVKSFARSNPDIIMVLTLANHIEMHQKSSISILAALNT